MDSITLTFYNFLYPLSIYFFTLYLFSPLLILNFTFLNDDIIYKSKCLIGCNGCHNNISHFLLTSCFTYINRLSVFKTQNSLTSTEENLKITVHTNMIKELWNQKKGFDCVNLVIIKRKILFNYRGDVGGVVLNIIIEHLVIV